MTQEFRLETERLLSSADREEQFAAMESIEGQFCDVASSGEAWVWILELARTGDRQRRRLLTIWIFEPMVRECLSVDNVRALLATMDDQELGWICEIVYAEHPQEWQRHLAWMAAEREGKARAVSAVKLVSVDTEEEVTLEPLSGAEEGSHLAG